jgi:hypothetical protein
MAIKFDEDSPDTVGVKVAAVRFVDASLAVVTAGVGLVTTLDPPRARPVAHLSEAWGDPRQSPG